MKLLTVVNSQQALGKLYTQDLPIRVSYKLKKLITAVDIELKEFGEFRNKLLEKYGKKTGEDSYIVGPDEGPAFTAELQELLETEVELEVPQFTLEEIADAKLSVQDLASLDFMISE